MKIYSKYCFLSLFLILLQCIFCNFIYAQTDLLDNYNKDSSFKEDSLFNKQTDEDKIDSKKTFKENVKKFISGKGFSVEASYSVMGGILPGWSEAPWYFETDTDYKDKFDAIVAAKMSAGIGIDIQPSRFLRIHQTISFSIPSPPLSIDEFYFDYNFKDLFFVKAGKYDMGWGYSPNFPYANLLARLPKSTENVSGSYIAKIDIPIYIGGIQLLTLTRRNFILEKDMPKLQDFSFGIKGNIAAPGFDIDIGGYYFKDMPLRFFYLLKTTMFKSLELYTEGMLAVSYTKKLEELENTNVLSYSFSFGLVQDFFRDYFRINAEIYFNGEGDSKSMQDSKYDGEKETVFLYEGINLAFNFRFKPGWKINFQMYTSLLYNLYKKSYQLTPGVSIEPAQHLRLYIAVPMALGERGNYEDGRWVGTYYGQNFEKYNRPFALILAVEINGSYKFGRFE
ncbi:MAG: hypothetical protein Ta2G_11830 [Termitinemataceae bacterium]|nr:MAG: hypothetical protein Ta2G_11830 [Termitinemataceae bacterium]